MNSLTPKETLRLKELIKKGNADPKHMLNRELFETNRLLAKAGVTPMMMLGNLLENSNDPTMKMLATILLAAKPKPAGEPERPEEGAGA